MDNERNNEIMNEEELSNILTLTDADGNELEFEFIDIIDVCYFQGKIQGRIQFR